MKLKDFIKNSSIVFISTIIGGVFSFAFHPVVARFLSVKEFAELESLISLSVILGVPVTAVGFIITRYISQFYAKKDLSQIKWLGIYFSKKILQGGGILLALFLLMSPLVAFYLRMEIIPVIITGFLMFFTIIGGIFVPMLRGMQKFGAVGVVGIVAAVFRFIFAILFAIIFTSLYGVLWGMLLAGVVVISINFRILWRYLKRVSIKTKNKNFSVKDYSYYIHSFFIVLFLIMFFNADVILVKNIFPVEEAAIYAAVAVLAKAIVFASAALESVMFPVVVEKYEKNIQFLYFFLRSLLILISGLLFSILIFYLFGNYFVLLMGERYISGGDYLWKMAIFISLFAIVNYLGKFLLAVKKTFIMYLLGIGAVIQISFGYLFSQNLGDFISGMSYAMLATLILLIAYLIKNKKKLALDSITDPEK